MIVYRLAHEKYADDLSGSGARLKGGRWNQPGTAVLYTSWSVSLALLEVLANAYTLENLRRVVLITIDVPDELPVYEIKLSRLHKHWWYDFEYTQWLGSDIMRSETPLIIKCPSAIIETEYNYLLNPAHSAFKKIGHRIDRNFRFDERLFKFFQ
jgi:RES domain-containing protein